MTERRFPVMGTAAHLVVHGEGSTSVDGLADRLTERLHGLEARWSRFRADSEISRINSAPVATRVPVSSETARLVAAAIDGYRVSSGRFHPMLLDHVVAAGYDTSLRLQRDTTVDAPLPVRERSEAPEPPDGLPLEVDLDATVVIRHSNAHLDPGGIGKGLAADLLVAEALHAGATAVLVNIGGDLRADAAPGVDRTWRIDVEEPRCADALATVLLRRGAVATSTRTRRRWRDAEGNEAHHLIDPTTGVPSSSPVLSASVVCAHGWQAEVLAKTLLLDGLGGDALDLVERLGAAALIRTATLTATSSRWGDFATADDRHGTVPPAAEAVA